MSNKTTSTTDLSSLLSSLLLTAEKIDENNAIHQVPYINYTDKKITNLIEDFFNGEIDIKDRIDIILEIYNRDYQTGRECLDKICSIYMFAPNTIFKELIYSISLSSLFDFDTRLNCAQTLHYNTNPEIKDLAYYSFSLLLPLSKVLPVPLQIQIIISLVESDKYLDVIIFFLTELITDTKYECEYRYKILINLLSEKESKDYRDKVLPICFYNFFLSTTSYTSYKILSAQYILNHKESYTKDIIDRVLMLILSFSLDTELDYNIRADSADFILHYSDDTKDKEVARDVILLLGRNINNYTTVYTNSQNAHNKKVEEGVSKFLLYLASEKTSNNTNDDNNSFLSFDDISKEINEILLYKKYSQDDIDKVNGSLLRILIDQTIYTGGQTLKSIFLKCWQIITTHLEKKELMNRLFDELIDMSDTCSSGHLSRLVNIFSGYFIEGKDFSLGISWEDQIKSNLLARITKRIQDIQDEEYQDKILEQLAMKGDLYTKPALSRFFRDNLLNIRDELYNEFVRANYIKEDEFEYYLRKAIDYFETGDV